MQNTEAMGEKIIAYKQKEMSGVADKIQQETKRGSPGGRTCVAEN